MRKPDNWEMVMAAAVLLLAIQTRADAYIDPGTGSVLFAVGLAPILAFLGLLGRRFIRIFYHPQTDDEVTGDADDDDDGDWADEVTGDADDEVTGDPDDEVTGDASDVADDDDDGDWDE